MAQHQSFDPARDRALLHKPESAAKSPAHDVPEHPLLTLQHQVGNTAIARMLAQRAGADEDEVQMKRIDRQLAQREDEGPEGEGEEVQTKRIDRQIAQRAGDEDEVQTKRIDRQIAQREDEGPEGEGEEVQAKRIDRQLAQREDEGPEGEGEEVQMKRDDDSPVVGPEGGDLDNGVSSAIQSRRGGGSPLDDSTRESMESGFGANFGNVRVHTDSAANSLNRQLSAKAFTTGSDIFFSDGAYQPGSSEGKSLLSHELTHVVQQRSMSSSGPMRVSPAGDAHEQEADSMAAKVTSQQTAAPAQRKGKDE
ncbi:MAG TPA: DUF4157 domain-containing protein [Chloroflexota bacterium]|nr:DUF4157 domain-containing protein [Chloroflexota bacterium]